MFKLVLFLVVVIVVIGLFTGTIKIQIDSEKLNELPKTAQAFLSNQSVASDISYYFTMWKRKAELAIAGSAEKKFELDMKYVGIDTEKLKIALDTNTNPADIIVKSKVLNESIARAKQGVEEISDKAIATFRDQWLKILAAADLELQRLSSLASEYEKYQEQLEKLAPVHVVSPTPSAIPLKF